MAKKIPLRMCIGCREMKEKRSLVRVVKNKDGDVSLDLTGKAPGRGAYVCHDAECLRKARKSRSLERTFKGKMDDALYDAMEEQLTIDN